MPKQRAPKKYTAKSVLPLAIAAVLAGSLVVSQCMWIEKTDQTQTQSGATRDADAPDNGHVR